MRHIQSILKEAFLSLLLFLTLYPTDTTQQDHRHAEEGKDWFHSLDDLVFEHSQESSIL